MIGEIGETLEWFYAAFVGWRFVFSSRYREKVLADWKGDTWYSVTWDIICGVAGVGFSIAVLALVVYLIVDITRS
ncbi:MAG: hypothetical protein IPL39_13170 [Opitutaceae bacterium]|nr:hypothetical protein [Opitutaceae bacterium]